MNEERVYAKSLKLADDEIICPSCNLVLTLSEDIINDEFVQCPQCDTAIINPLGDNRKFLTCGNCGIELVLLKPHENFLMVECSNCGDSIYNIHSDKYTPLICPYCRYESHVPEEISRERYLTCPDCMREFKNPLR